MTKHFGWSGLLAIAVLVAGCATITRGTTQTVTLDTPGVAGAKCTLTSSAVGMKSVVTPATVTLEKGQDAVAVHCSKECYHDGKGIIASNIEGMTAGNIIVVTRDPDFRAPGATVAQSLEAAVDQARALAAAGGIGEIMVIGGADLY